MAKKFTEIEDKQMAGFIKRQIKDNGGYCPSKAMKNDDTICPCAVVRSGAECECGLYVSKRKKG